MGAGRGGVTKRVKNKLSMVTHSVQSQQAQVSVTDNRQMETSQSHSPDSMKLPQ